METKKALAKAMNYCARSEKAPGDVRKKLIQWGLLPTAVEEVMHRLIEENFLNESRYTRAYVRDKLQFNAWGKIKIRYQLKQKEISQSVIDQALDEIDPAMYQTRLLQLLHKKHRSVANDENLLQTKAKLVRYAAGHGFEPGLIYKTVEEILKGSKY